jgi:hypothetical protein
VHAIAGVLLCPMHLDLTRAIAHDAGAVMPDENRLCECGNKLRRKSNTGRWPTKCQACKIEARSGQHANGKAPRVRATEPDNEAAESPAANGERDAIDVITEFKLDYLVGTAARYILDVDDAGEEGQLPNLVIAREYLDRAIAARGGADA